MRLLMVAPLLGGRGRVPDVFETLGPLQRLDPGAEAVHDEHWSILRASIGATDDELDRDLLPILRGLPPITGA